MATRDVVVLNETTPQLEVAQVGDTYNFPRSVTITGDLSATGNIAGVIEDSDISPAEGMVRKTGAGAYTAIKTNLTATVAPTVNDDTAAGYSVSSPWFDVTADIFYFCVDATTGAAIWSSGPVIIKPFIIAASDEVTDLAISTPAATFRMPHALTLTDIRANVNTAPVGSTIIVDVNVNGVSILSTKITIDASEKTSVTAAIPPVLSSTVLADDDEITVDIDQVGSTTAGTGLKITLIGN